MNGQITWYYVTHLLDTLCMVWVPTAHTYMILYKKKNENLSNVTFIFVILFIFCTKVICYNFLFLKPIMFEPYVNIGSHKCVTIGLCLSQEYLSS